MRKQLIMICVVALLGICSNPVFALDKTSVAVVDFGASALKEELSKQASNKFRQVLTKSQVFQVYSGADIDKALEKNDLLYKMKQEQVDCQNVACAVKVGTALKVKNTIIGKILKKKDKYILWAKMINVSKRDVTFLVSVEGELNTDLNQLAEKLGNKMVEWMPKEGETDKQAKGRRQKAQLKEEAEKKRQIQARLKKLAYRKPGTCPSDMILIPAGEFTMGSPVDDPERLSNEAKNKKVMVKEFCIDKYEYPNKKGEIPFRKAEWFAGKEVCESMGKHLCTESEWEKACKSGKGFRYTYGNEFNKKKCNTAGSRADNKVDRIERAGGYKDCVNDYGIYDMSGNVWEWTADYYNVGSRTFVLRGGSFAGSPSTSRCSMRREGMPFIHRKDIGFRCCK